MGDGAAGGNAVVQLLLALLNVVQTIALAYIASRSRRVRASDSRRRRPPADTPAGAGRRPAKGRTVRP